jgi:hypothetical protein
MNQGPRTKQIKKAVKLAYIARNVMYRKTLNADMLVCNG